MQELVGGTLSVWGISSWENRGNRTWKWENGKTGMKISHSMRGSNEYDYLDSTQRVKSTLKGGRDNGLHTLFQLGIGKPSQNPEFVCVCVCVCVCLGSTLRFMVSKLAFEPPAMKRVESAQMARDFRWEKTRSTAVHPPPLHCRQTALPQRAGHQTAPTYVCMCMYINETYLIQWHLWNEDTSLMRIICKVLS